MSVLLYTELVLAATIHCKASSVVNLPMPNIRSIKSN